MCVSPTSVPDAAGGWPHGETGQSCGWGVRLGSRHMPVRSGGGAHLESHRGLGLPPVTPLDLPLRRDPPVLEWKGLWCGAPSLRWAISGEAPPRRRLAAARPGPQAPLARARHRTSGAHRPPQVLSGRRVPRMGLWVRRHWPSRIGEGARVAVRWAMATLGTRAAVSQERDSLLDVFSTASASEQRIFGNGLGVSYRRLCEVPRRNTQKSDLQAKGFSRGLKPLWAFAGVFGPLGGPCEVHQGRSPLVRNVGRIPCRTAQAPLHL